MFYGIEKSTDMRCPNTVIKKFTSIKNLKNWLKIQAGYSYGDDTNYTYPDPENAKNYHHTYRHGYELKGRINKADPIFKERGSRDYPMYDVDRLAAYIEKYGTHIIEYE